MGFKKKGTHTFGYFFAGTFFLFELIFQFKQKKVPGKTDFAGTVFLFELIFSSNRKKVPAKKYPKV